MFTNVQRICDCSKRNVNKIIALRRNASKYDRAAHCSPFPYIASAHSGPSRGAFQTGTGGFLRSSTDERTFVADGRTFTDDECSMAANPVGNASAGCSVVPTSTGCSFRVAGEATTPFDPYYGRRLVLPGMWARPAAV